MGTIETEAHTHNKALILALICDTETIDIVVCAMH